MNGLNKVQLIGNLGRDPEVRHTPAGTQVANFTLATNETFNDRNGNRQERTEWHRIVVWSKLAEICGQYLSKGEKVYIEGRLQTRQWEDQQGQKRQTTEIVAQNMIMLGRGGAGGGQGGGQGGAYQGAGATAGAAEGAQGYSGGGGQGGQGGYGGGGGNQGGGNQGAVGGYVPDSSMDPASDDDDLPF